ncbi:MAG: AAA-like domain-containing protein [Clostridiales bacterium]|jgi:hypothetical protein|nr:AAA-like domain-containing protein [Clostridiales bacterium]
MLDAARRQGGEALALILSLIEEEQYFVIHAARQTGKTTLLLELTRRLNEAGEYYTLYCSLENAERLTDAKEGVPAIIHSVKTALEGNLFPHAAAFASGFNHGDFSNALQDSLTKYCRLLDKPLILFFDEIDCLSGQTLISVLCQLRNGYVNRQLMPFVHSLALVGMRSVRDYRDEYRLPEHTLGTASPFNIVTEYLTLHNFTRDEIAELYTQHATDTGQVFSDSVIDFIWRRTQGQPWLVNALAREIVLNATDDSVRPVIPDMAAAAIQTLLVRRDTHFDSLMARLKEERVRRVIEPVILGKNGEIDRLSDDYRYVQDMGLIRDDHGCIEPANPIYAEAIARALSWNAQQDIEEAKYPYQMPRYLKGGLIDMDFLLSDFQTFWRENASIWREKFDYKEAAPHLILQAFLQRVVNGGGRISREFAAGTGRVDLCVEVQRCKYPIELKLRYSDQTYMEGIQQTLAYMETLGCGRGWLLVFDLRKKVSWEKKIFVRKEQVAGKTVCVYGC